MYCKQRNGYTIDMMGIPTLPLVNTSNVSLVSKNAKTQWSKDYYEILSNDKIIKLAISGTTLNTRRGVYSKFVQPSSDISYDLTSIGELAAFQGAPFGKGALQLDIALDITKSSDNLLYQSLRKFEDDLHTHIAEALDSRTGTLAKYLSGAFKGDVNVKDMIKCNFIRTNKSNENVKYLHLKVNHRSNFYNENGTEIDQSFLCYKSFMIMPIVVIDNIRIPSSTFGDPKLIVNLQIDSALIQECSSVSKYDELMSVKA